jgi:cbb3-type cytochrome oxidase cytochrome c subunit
LTKPADSSRQRLWDRRGPDLYYAGQKFKKDWLVQWLQAPTRLRPAGELYAKHIKPGPERDVIDEQALPAHVRLSPADAETVTTALMALSGPPGFVEQGAFKQAPVNATLGRLFFTKLRGCASCHMAAPGEGGVSGPELYSAGQRLQPDYIYSYIKDPHRFDPYVWMPKFNLTEQDLQRLTGHLAQIPSGEQQP